VAALRKRINQADMSSDERDRYVNAVLQMKKTGYYDWYVRTHIDSMWMTTANPGTMNMWAHHRPAFLPWHRQLMLDFENDLRTADTQLTGKPSDLTLPYWDWINYRSKKKFLWWGRIWGDNFMGPNGSGADGKVTDGKFQAGPGWVLSYDPGPGYMPFTQATVTYLTRQFGQDPNVDSLPTQEQWDAARNLTVYDSAPWDRWVGVQPAPVPNPVKFAHIDSFRNVFEGWVPYYDSATALPVNTNLHNRVHVWVGGAMGPMSSPNDPVFFLHHCNVDRLWAQWWSDDPSRPYLPKDGEPNATDPNNDPDTTIDLQGHHLNDPMPPWDGRNDPLKGPMPVIRPSDVLNHLALGYGYWPDDKVSLSAVGVP
jgi:tyrosinase